MKNITVSLDDLHEKLGGRMYAHYIHTLCPFHDDTKASFMVRDTGYYKCLACGVSGSNENLLKHLSGEPVKETRSGNFPNWRKWLHDIELSDMCKSSHKFLRKNPSYRIYLQKRGIDKLTSKAKIGYKEGYYLFPILDEFGDIVSCVVRSGEGLSESPDQQRYFRLPGDMGVLYTLNGFQQNTYLVVVFGIIDMLSLTLLNIPCVTSTSGKLFPVELLDQYRCKIFVIPDRGEEKEGMRLARNLGWRGVFVDLPYPDYCKDCNDILTIYGKVTLDKLIKKEINICHH